MNKMTKQMLTIALTLIMGFGGIAGGSAAAMADANVAKAEEVCQHKIQWVTTTKAHWLYDGDKEGTCSICGEKFKKRIARIDDNKLLALDNTKFVYNGKVQYPKDFAIFDIDGNRLIKGKDYELTWENKKSKNYGTYFMDINFKGDYCDSYRTYYFIEMAPFPAKVKLKTVTLKMKDIKKAIRQDRNINYGKKYYTVSGIPKNQKAYICITSKETKYAAIYNANSLWIHPWGLKKKGTYYLKTTVDIWSPNDNYEIPKSQTMKIKIIVK